MTVNPGNLPLVEHLFSQDPAVNHLGLELVESQLGTVTMALTIEDRHLNFNGTCHGGVIFTLADTAFGLAGNSHGFVAAGVNTNISFHAGSKKGDRLIARCRESTRSRSLSSYIVEVMRNDERLVATLTGTAFITANNHEQPGT